jgi:hypothetical protein
MQNIQNTNSFYVKQKNALQATLILACRAGDLMCLNLNYFKAANAAS